MNPRRATTDAPANRLGRRRKRGGGGVVAVRDGVWRVDLEIGRDPVTGRCRRVSRTVGAREDAEIALARVKVADHETRLPSGGTSARSVRAAFQLYQRAVEAGLVELAPRTKVTVRSAAKTMSSILLPDGRVFGDVRLSRLTWQDIEEMYAAMRATGRGPVTGKGVPGEHQRCVEAGANDYVPKPVDTVELLTVMRPYLPMLSESKQ